MKHMRGGRQDDGYVATTSKYKIKLSPVEAQSMLFWNYHSNTTNPNIPAWNSGFHRYFQYDVAAQILRDIGKFKKYTSDSLLAQEFFEYFCKINDVNFAKIEKPSGALKLL